MCPQLIELSLFSFLTRCLLCVVVVTAVALVGLVGLLYLQKYFIQNKTQFLIKKI
jgi:hypothetical protein